MRERGGRVCLGHHSTDHTNLLLLKTTFFSTIRKKESALLACVFNATQHSYVENMFTELCVYLSAITGTIVLKVTSDERLARRG